MPDDGAYVLFVRPIGRAVISDFFNSYGEVFALLTRPPETRDGSFGLRMAAMPQLMDAQYWDLHGQDAFHGRTRRLRLYPDGTIIFRAPIDESFLSWPHERAHLFVNPVVVADSALSFCRFTRRVMDLMSQKPESFEFGVELRNAATAEPPLRMYAGRLRSASEIMYLNPDVTRAVGEYSPKRSIAIATEELSKSTQEDEFIGADSAAFVLARAFYDIFGFTEAEMPYVDRTTGAPRLSVKALG